MYCRNGSPLCALRGWTRVSGWTCAPRPRRTLSSPPRPPLLPPPAASPVSDHGGGGAGEARAGPGPAPSVVVPRAGPPLPPERRFKPLLEEASGKTEGVGFCLASNPEFLRAASAADDFRWPWMTVI